MVKTFFVALLAVALSAIGYERFWGGDPGVQQEPAVQEDTFRSAEGGDGWPPPPPCLQNCP